MDPSPRSSPPRVARALRRQRPSALFATLDGTPAVTANKRLPRKKTKKTRRSNPARTTTSKKPTTTNRLRLQQQRTAAASTGTKSLPTLPPAPSSSTPSRHPPRTKRNPSTSSPLLLPLHCIKPPHTLNPVAYWALKATPFFRPCLSVFSFFDFGWPGFSPVFGQLLSPHNFRNIDIKRLTTPSLSPPPADIPEKPSLGSSPSLPVYAASSSSSSSCCLPACPAPDSLPLPVPFPVRLTPRSKLAHAQSTRRKPRQKTVTTGQLSRLSRVGDSPLTRSPAPVRPPSVEEEGKERLVRLLKWRPSSVVGGVDRRQWRKGLLGSSGLDTVLHGALDSIDPSGESVRMFMETWLARYVEEEPLFDSKLIFCEVKLRELTRATKHLQRPNPFRTWVCCDLLLKLIETFTHKRTQRIVSQAVQVLVGAIYTAETSSMGLVPYARRTVVLQEELEAARTKHSHSLKRLHETQTRWHAVLSKFHPAILRSMALWTVPIKTVIFQHWRQWARVRRRSRGGPGHVGAGFGDRLVLVRRRNEMKSEAALCFAAWRSYTLQQRVHTLQSQRVDLQTEVDRLLSQARQSRRLKYGLRDELDSTLKELNESLVRERTLTTQVARCEQLLLELSGQHELARHVIDSFVGLVKTLSMGASESIHRLMQQNFQDVKTLGDGFERSSEIVLEDRGGAETVTSSLGVAQRLADAVSDSKKKKKKKHKKKKAKKPKKVQADAPAKAADGATDAEEEHDEDEAVDAALKADVFEPLYHWLAFQTEQTELFREFHDTYRSISSSGAKTLDVEVGVPMSPGGRKRNLMLLSNKRSARSVRDLGQTPEEPEDIDVVDAAALGSREMHTVAPNPYRPGLLPTLVRRSQALRSLPGVTVSGVHNVVMMARRTSVAGVVAGSAAVDEPQTSASDAAHELMNQDLVLSPLIAASAMHSRRRDVRYQGGGIAGVLDRHRKEHSKLPSVKLDLFMFDSVHMVEQTQLAVRKRMKMNAARPSSGASASSSLSVSRKKTQLSVKPGKRLPVTSFRGFPSSEYSAETPWSSGAERGVRRAGAQDTSIVEYYDFDKLDKDVYDSVVCWLANAYPAMPAQYDDLIMSDVAQREELAKLTRDPQNVTHYQQLEDALGHLHHAFQTVNSQRDVILDHHRTWEAVVSVAEADVIRRLTRRINLTDESNLDEVSKYASKKYTRLSAFLRELLDGSGEDGDGEGDDEGGAAEDKPDSDEAALRAALDGAASSAESGAPMPPPTEEKPASDADSASPDPESEPEAPRLSTSEEVEQCEIVLGNWFVRLRTLFRSACGSRDFGGEQRSETTMTNFQYWRLLRKAKIPGRSCPASFIDALYARKIEAKNAVWARLMKDLTPQRSGLNFDDFVELMVRVANRTYSGKVALHTRIQRLMERKLFADRDAIKKASASSLGEFREVLASSAAEQVFERHQRWLSETFRAYSSTKRDGQSNMSMEDFDKFVSDAQLVSENHLPFAVIKEVFRRVQIDEDDEDDGGFGGAAQMVYYEFVEAIAALSCYVLKNPYLPMESKIDKFVSTILQKRRAVERKRAEYVSRHRRRGAKKTAKRKKGKSKARGSRGSQDSRGSRGSRGSQD